ncbi:hypothetical protein AN963_16640 [Brevibacillus choshinensis]|uniref:Uncharacterized protein n=1 Tax=Brevibacillus choshinensis TaxID=54911 RepID=A0ABR5N7F0_BRECH|nr:hypothetical protein [Brevibacillus choshinensis]KQL46550.1 hypothetical protein AN963_16640 [Brevibacillus choshinensis]
MEATAAQKRYAKMLLALTLCGMSIQTWLTPAHAFSKETTSQPAITKSETGEYIVKFSNGAPQKTTKLRAADNGATLADSSD